MCPNGIQEMVAKTCTRCFMKHLRSVNVCTNGIQMEYRGCGTHAQDVSWSTFVQSRRFYFRCAYTMTKRINTNALFDVVGLIDFQVCNRYRAQKNKSTVLKASMKTVSCVLFEFFRRAFRRGM